MRARTVVAGVGALASLLLTPVAWANRDTSNGASAAVPAGATLFGAKGCSSCHTGPDSSPIFEAGPSLADAPEWAGSRADGMTADEYIEQSIRQPTIFISPAFRPNGPAAYMPSLTLTDDEIEALVDYVLQR